MTEPLRMNDPIPGHYLRRLVRNGPLVPVKIYYVDGDRDDDGELMSDQLLCCEVAGDRADPFLQWLYCAGHATTEEDYNYRMAILRHVQEHEPDAPERTPTVAVDLSRMKPLF